MKTFSLQSSTGLQNDVPRVGRGVKLCTVSVYCHQQVDKKFSYRKQIAKKNFAAVYEFVQNMTRRNVGNN